MFPGYDKRTAAEMARRGIAKRQRCAGIVPATRKRTPRVQVTLPAHGRPTQTVPGMLVPTVEVIAVVRHLRHG